MFKWFVFDHLSRFLLVHSLLNDVWQVCLIGSFLLLLQQLLHSFVYLVLSDVLEQLVLLKQALDHVGGLFDNKLFL